MDSQLLASREDLYHVQMDVKHVQAVQLNHADRLLRLEKRQADDAALKSVWGTSSPFPGVLSGTPHQDPIPNTPNDIFNDFDDEQGQTLLGSLHIEADEEPVRRGASRANSVRFDVSALQGSNWTAGSRNSGDLGPLRPSSGFGSHPMIERSFSHKSDGRHSSAGHSVHSIHSVQSGRTSSLGLDTNFVIGGGQDGDSSLDLAEPPPGLFILGTVPSIIRCWLGTTFSHSSLLYAAVCTGSQRSLLDYTLVKDLGLQSQIEKDPNGRQSIKLAVYLPEAIITHTVSRSNSPAPQLPSLSADFEIFGMNQRMSDRKKGLRVILGSDTLRSHNADILFSQNVMIIYGDDRNKLSVPFSRPEDENMFKNLCTMSMPPEKNELKATAPSFTPTDSKTKVESTPDVVNLALAATQHQSAEKDAEASCLTGQLSPIAADFSNSRQRVCSVKSSGSIANGYMADRDKHHATDGSATEAEALGNTTPETARRGSSGAIWSSWRQGVTFNGTDSESISGYQRATRGGGRSMKILKPASKHQNYPTLTPTTISLTPSSSSSPSTSVACTPAQSAVRSSSSAGAAYEPPLSSHSLADSRRKSQVSIGGSENIPLRWASKKTSSEESQVKSIAMIPCSSNPVGGASAFAWMNAGKNKVTTTAE